MRKSSQIKPHNSRATATIALLRWRRRAAHQRGSGKESFGPKIAKSVQARPDGLLLHENLVFSLFPPHVGMRQYWRDFASLESWARSEPHREWWRRFLPELGRDRLLARSVLHARRHGGRLRHGQRHWISLFRACTSSARQHVFCSGARTAAWKRNEAGPSSRREFLFMTSGDGPVDYSAHPFSCRN